MQCPKCSAMTTDKYKYCKICAFDLTKMNISENKTQPSFTELPSQSAHTSGIYPVQSEIITNSSPLSSSELFITETPSNFLPSKNLKIFGGVMLSAIGLLGVFFAVSSFSAKTESPNFTSSNNILPNNSNKANSLGYMSSVQSNSSKIGRLVTDLNIRDAPNKDAYSLGIHFMNAKVRILEETSYEYEGKVSTWYRVQIIEYGCSKDRNLGCGKNSQSDSDEGWVNAKHILLN